MSLAFIMEIVSDSLLVLNPSMEGNLQAQTYIVNMDMIAI